jgi:hypothetical protein
MNKVFIPWIGVGLVAIFGAFMIFQDSIPTNSTNGSEESNVFIKEGVQYVTLTAKGGYTPRLSSIA